MVEEGTFRRDLFYRLNVFPVQLPPLRDRGEDVVLLAEAFVRKLTERTGREALPLIRQRITGVMPDWGADLGLAPDNGH